jgi:uncharacterized SAM-binding protein YcdF (DUF218 family)
MRTILRILRSSLAALGLLMVIVTATPLVHVWARWLAGPLDDPTGDVLIVLGYSGTNDGILSAGSYQRSAYAVRAYRERGFRQILVTGGADSSGLPINSTMADFLICQGVPRDKILLESRSTSTRENAVYTTEMLRSVPGSKVLLTSDYHMYRASCAFRKTGLQVLSRPYPDVLKRASFWRGRWPAFLDLLTETTKIAYYRLRGWI